MATKSLPDQAYLRECFEYAPETGIFRWKRRPLSHFGDDVTWRKWNTKLAGYPVGTIAPDGYVTNTLNGTSFKTHRLIWKWMTGETPPDDIDHINNKRTDNRWGNMRLATRGENTRNRIIVVGQKYLKGTCPHHTGKWQASICVRGKRHWLGTFATMEEGHAAYCKAAKAHFGDFANPGHDGSIRTAIRKRNAVP